MKLGNTMPLTLTAAAEYLSISTTLLKNFINNSREINTGRRGNRYALEQVELDRWLSLKQSRNIILTLADYRRALEFSFRINYGGHTTTDFGTSRQRGILKAISDWTQGMLAEIALEKFLLNRYNINIALDFSVHEAYVTGQDITQVIRNNVANPPRIRVSIKSGKMNSCFLIIGHSEYERTDRNSDYYVYVRLDFPEDHLIRALKEHEIISSMHIPIPDLGDINSYIAGYTTRDNLTHSIEIPGQVFDSPRYVINVGSLHNSDMDWENFSNLL